MGPHTRLLQRKPMRMQQKDRINGWDRMDNYSLCPCIACVNQLCKQLQGSSSCLQTGPLVWACEICILARGAFKLCEARRWPQTARACGAGEDVFHTRGRRRQEGAPREPVRGDRRRAVLDSFEQLQIDFQAKHICICETVLRAI